MIPEPVIKLHMPSQAADALPLAVAGQSFDIREWTGSGPPYLHVHHADDEAWHILEGTLTFQFVDRTVEASAGTTVFVPAGVAHTYCEAHGPTRYLIIMPPRLRELIAALQAAPHSEHKAVLRRYESDMVELSARDSAA